MAKNVKPKHGEKMIEVKIRLWTNDLSEEEGAITPKHAWSSGVVRMEPNESHGIKPKTPKPFRSLLHLPFVIEQTLVDHGIMLHPSSQMLRYVDTPKPVPKKRK